MAFRVEPPTVQYTAEWVSKLPKLRDKILSVTDAEIHTLFQPYVEAPHLAEMIERIHRLQEIIR